MVPGKDVGPVISAAARERIKRYIDEAEAAGAKVLVDGRQRDGAGKEGGYYIGPTIIDHVTPDMRIAQEEVFGPVLVDHAREGRGRGAARSRTRRRTAMRRRCSPRAAPSRAT